MSDELMAENFSSYYSAGERMVPMDTVMKRLDEYLGCEDYVHAEEHLRFWIGEAVIRRDGMGRLVLLNELMGLLRKTSKCEAAIETAQLAQALCVDLGVDGRMIHGTTLVNAATVYKAFGRAAEALPLYREALTVYEATLPENDARRGGLYNNMALALVDIAQYDEAEDMYRRALDVMSHNRFGELEMAVTYLNMANEVEARYGLIPAEERINEYIDRARELLDTPGIPRDGYYAFVCDKCAPTFGYYGYFLDADELCKRARRIYSENSVK